MSFASDFWIREHLSESAISIVFRAVRNNDGLPCVIKCLKAEYPTDKELGRYHREFEMVRAADFSGVVRCLEMRHYNRSLMLVYEDFEAISLRHLLINRTLSINEFYDIATQVVETLGSLHRAQIIHKDINPSNIVVNPGTGEAKIIDFGIASRVPAEQQAIASPKLLEGTLAYMSPEQTGRMNRVLDYRTDFYSLGATFYEMLSRTRLFEADDDMELVHCQIARDPVPLHRRSPEIPLALSKIVMKLLAKTAEDRYQSSAGLLADLAAVRATGRLDRF